MAFSLKPLREQTIVVTDASSGIGLATAERAASQGARVVLAARNGQALEEVERRIKDRGGEASYLVTDVGYRAEVERLADHARALRWLRHLGQQCRDRHFRPARPSERGRSPASVPDQLLGGGPRLADRSWAS